MDPPKGADFTEAVGQHLGTKGKKKKKKKTKVVENLLVGEPKVGSHTDAVMSLSWHHAYPSRLASGSADCLVRSVVSQ